MKCISIIVPVYNVAPFLAECLDSILRQTYPYLEVIVVNDGSTDGGGEICNEYAKLDDRIIVIHQENQGSSAARNAGLRIAKGEYISFIDSDDYIAPQMFEVLLLNLEKYQTDISIVQFIEGPNRREHFSTRKEEEKVQVIDGNRLMSSVFGKFKMLYISAWGKLYTRKVLVDMFFIDTPAEDFEFNIRVYQNVGKAVVIHDALYYYFIRANSLSNAEYFKVRSLQTLLLSLKHFSSDQMLMRGALLIFMWKRMIFARETHHQIDYHEYCREVSELIVKETQDEFIKNPTIPLLIKCRLLLFYYVPFTYAIFMWVCDVVAQIRKSI